MGKNRNRNLGARRDDRPSRRVKINRRVAKDKVLVLGSGPSALFVRRMYLSSFDVVCMDDSWFLVRPEDISYWYASDRFESNGVQVPSKSVSKKIKLSGNEWKSKYLDDGEFVFDTPRSKSTSFLDVMSMVLRGTSKHNRWREIWLLGCDHNYASRETHFFGTRSGPDQDTRELLEKNAPYLSDVPATPFRFGEKWLHEHFLRIRREADRAGVKIVVASCDRYAPLWQGVFPEFY
jgi:hypothetical protein